jgi:hypothetical protein
MSEYPTQREGLIRAGASGEWDKAEFYYLGPPEREGYVCLTVAEYQRLLACERLALAVRGMPQNSYLSHLPTTDGSQVWLFLSEEARRVTPTPEAALGIEEDK